MKMIMIYLLYLIKKLIYLLLKEFKISIKIDLNNYEFVLKKS